MMPKRFLTMFSEVISMTLPLALVLAFLVEKTVEARSPTQNLPQCNPTDDPSFTPTVAHPLRAPQTGPVIMYDEAHHNHHTISSNGPIPGIGGTAAALGRFLRSDGYRIKVNRGKFTAASLAGARVLVIVEPAARTYVGLNPFTKKCERNIEGAAQPAFTVDEVEVVSQWVSKGGSLIMVYDHPPFAESAQILATEFGVDLHHPNSTVHIGNFSRDAGTIIDPQHPIFRGRGGSETISHLSGFNLLHHTVAEGIPLLRYSSSRTIRMDTTLKGEGAFLRLNDCRGQASSANPCNLRDLIRDTDMFLKSLNVKTVGRAAAFSEILHRKSPSDPGGKVFFIGEGSKLTVQLLSGFTSGGLRDPSVAQFVLNLMRYSAGDL